MNELGNPHFSQLLKNSVVWIQSHLKLFPIVLIMLRKILVAIQGFHFTKRKSS